jgi:phosphopantothenate-cysteine ligase
MNVLITGGSTCVPIDNVRRIGNIFSGKTGIRIAQYFLEKDNYVTLLNSKSLIEYSDDNIKELIWNDNLVPIYYKEFNDLKYFLQKELTTPIFLENGTEFHYDVIIHSAAVSDYGVGGAYELICDKFDITGQFENYMKLIREPKIKSGREEIYLQLVPLPKIVDLIRDEWGFDGILVKFKLESQKSDDELIEIALASMKKSKANFIVANCLEWYSQRAIVISEDGTITRVTRDDMNAILYNLIQQRLEK